MLDILAKLAQFSIELRRTELIAIGRHVNDISMVLFFALSLHFIKFICYYIKWAYHIYAYQYIQESTNIEHYLLISFFRPEH